ncbi:MAG TPA: heavy metal-associated domain-containing protein [Dehalococcoidia bacterium]|nr:heavy metal-associated domain-containing protein [Dehalococcoidia bacterium]
MRAALAGLPGVEAADVDLRAGAATVVAAPDLPAERAVEAVRGRVILSWARGFLARVPVPGRRSP